MLLGTMFSILSAHVSVASLLNGHVQPSQNRSQGSLLGRREAWERGCNPAC